MAKRRNTHHVQCRMFFPTETALITYTAWIPEEFASVGKKLRLFRNDCWQNGWVVVEVGTKLESQYVFEHERDYVTQREASDI
jgi:hypothetical protein